VRARARPLTLASEPIELDPATSAGLSGWVLVESFVGRQSPADSANLRVRRRTPAEPLARVEDIELPVNGAGMVHELIRLPGDAVELAWQPPAGVASARAPLTVRRVSWPERIVRMAYRIFWIRAVLPDHMRREAGLTFWRVLRDVAAAYRVASAFRARHPSVRYADWIKYFDVLRSGDVERIKQDIERFREPTHFRVLILSAGTSPAPLQATLASLDAQLYASFTSTTMENVDVFRLAELNADLALGGPQEWVMILRAGDVVPAHALYWFAREAQRLPDAVAIYSDDDRIDAQGRRSDPRFKPDWSPVHFASVDYVGAAVIVRSRAAVRGGGLRPGCLEHGNYDLLLRVIDAADKDRRNAGHVGHIPAVLLHRGDASAAAQSRECGRWSAAVLQDHFRRCGIAAQVEAATTGRRRIRYRLPDPPPLVSIVVPTRDGIAVLRQCVESVLSLTAYSRYELLIVDNQSTDAATLAYLVDVGRRPGVRVLPYRKPFNFSAINNFAAREAAGELLCLLNNDTQVITPGWLDEMAGHLLQEGVGVVGAKLYYPDGRVQHGGVTVGPGGCANHLHAGVGRNDPGYCGRALLAQECSAVTAACLLTRRDLYQKLGGLNERWLPVTFNDVDFCLRAWNAGYRVIYTPHAELFHHESATRGRDDLTLRKSMRVFRELKYMRTRWRERMKHDPFYNPNLSYQRPDFSLGEAGRVDRPWISRQPPRAASGMRAAPVEGR